MLTVYIIVKLLLKLCRKLRYNLRVLSNYVPREKDSGSFLWKNIGPGQVEFANVLVRCPGVPLGQSPGMAADKCIAAVEKHNEYQDKIEFKLLKGK